MTIYLLQTYVIFNIYKKTELSFKQGLHGGFILSKFVGLFWCISTPKCKIQGRAYANSTRMYHTAENNRDLCVS